MTKNISEDRRETRFFGLRFMDVWYGIAKSIVRTYLFLFTDGFELDGKENILPGPKIVVANHTYVTDAFVLPSIFPEKLHFLIQEDTFTLPVFGKLLALADQIPVVVGQGREALKIARDRLDIGHTVVIFPEGHLNHAEGLRRAGSGAAILALQSGAPILPMGIYVPSDFVKSVQAHMHDRTVLGAWQTRGELFVKIGEPWLPPAIDAADRSYHYLREMTNRMMEQVSALIQQAQQLAGKK
jgi:1-acyl-sn-glycerol-3-phosphate acyltransferase